MNDNFINKLNIIDERKKKTLKRNFKDNSSVINLSNSPKDHCINLISSICKVRKLIYLEQRI